MGLTVLRCLELANNADSFCWKVKSSRKSWVNFWESEKRISANHDSIEGSYFRRILKKTLEKLTLSGFFDVLLNGDGTFASSSEAYRLNFIMASLTLILFSSVSGEVKESGDRMFSLLSPFSGVCSTEFSRLIDRWSILGRFRGGKLGGVCSSMICSKLFLRLVTSTLLESKKFVIACWNSLTQSLYWTFVCVSRTGRPTVCIEAGTGWCRIAGDDGEDGNCGGGRYGGGNRLGESPKSDDTDTMLTGLIQALVSIDDSSDGASL